MDSRYIYDDNGELKGILDADDEEIPAEAADPSVKADETIEKAARKDLKAHFDAINLLTLSVCILVFGVILLTMTDHQDYTSSNELTKENFFSGNYFARLESSFNDSIPLGDYFENLSRLIKASFGLGNDPDLIKISGNSDDPVAVDTDNAYVPIDESSSTDDSADEQEEIPEDVTETSDDGKNKEISAISLTGKTTSSGSDDDSDSAETTTTNMTAPGATTTTTVMASVTTTPTTTEAVNTTTTTTAKTTTTTTASSTTAATTTTTSAADQTESEPEGEDDG